MMKFAMNHPYKFDNYFSAFVVGFFQVMAIASIELVNFAILLTNDNALETIMNFLALVILAEFSEKFFEAAKDDHVSTLLSDGSICFFKQGKEEEGVERTLDEITKIEVTTSQFARFRLQSNLREEILNA